MTASNGNGARLVRGSDGVIRTAAEAQAIAAGRKDCTPATAAQAASAQRSADPVRKRIQAVDHAVKNDPMCSGKALLALQMLADPALARLSGDAIVTLLKLSDGEATVSPSDVKLAEEVWGAALARASQGGTR